MGDSLKNAKLKALRIAREERQRNNIVSNKELDTMSGINKLEYEINNLVNTIKLGQDDLKNFPNNIMIIRKINLAEEQLKIKREKIEKIKDEK